MEIKIDDFKHCGSGGRKSYTPDPNDCIFGGLELVANKNGLSLRHKNISGEEGIQLPPETLKGLMEFVEKIQSFKQEGEKSFPRHDNPQLDYGIRHKIEITEEGRKYFSPSEWGELCEQVTLLMRQYCHGKFEETDVRILPHRNRDRII